MQQSILLPDGLFDDNDQLFKKMKDKLTTARKSKRKFLENRMKIAEGFLPIEFYQDKEYILQSLEKNGSKILYDIHPEAFSDRQILLETLKILKKDNFASVRAVDGEIIEQYCDDREIVKLVIEIDSDMFDSEKFKFDRELCLAACIGSSLYCEKINPEFMEDEEFLLSAIEGNVEVFECTSDKWKNDKEFIRKALKRNGNVLSKLSDEFIRDNELARIAVESNPNTFEDISEKGYAGKEIAKLAVEKDGMLIRFVNTDIEDNEICRIAVRQNPHALEYASDEMKNDRDLVMEAVRIEGSSLPCASAELLSDTEFIQQVIENFEIGNVNDVFHKTAKALLYTVKKLGYCPVSAPAAFNNIDKEFALDIVRINGSMIIPMLQWIDDRDVMLAALESSSPEDRKFICNYLYMADKDLIYEIFVNYCMDIIGQISELDIELLKKLIQINGYAFRLMSGNFKDEPILIEEAWKQCGIVEEPSEELYLKRMHYAYPELL